MVHRSVVTGPSPCSLRRASARQAPVPPGDQPSLLAYIGQRDSLGPRGRGRGGGGGSDLVGVILTLWRSAGPVYGRVPLYWNRVFFS